MEIKQRILSLTKVGIENIRDSKIGYKLLMSVSLITSIGGFIADFNKTHLFNPNWPPHCKFHDAMSIIGGSLLGATGFYLIYKKDGDQMFQLKLGTLLPVYFWTAMGLSFTFPGAKGLEAEFPSKVPKAGSVWLNEGIASISSLVLLGIGYLIERSRRINGLTRNNIT